MAGDKSCKSVSSLSPTRVMCYDKDGNQTGYRDAMTQQDMGTYTAAVIQHQTDVDELTRSIQQVGQSFQNSSQQILQQSQQYRPPAVRSFSSNDNSGAITFTRSGNVIQGSNGVTYNQVGDILMGSDGTKCQIVGPNIICH